MITNNLLFSMAECSLGENLFDCQGHERPAQFKHSQKMGTMCDTARVELDTRCLISLVNSDLDNERTVEVAWKGHRTGWAVGRSLSSTMPSVLIPPWASSGVKWWVSCSFIFFFLPFSCVLRFLLSSSKSHNSWRGFVSVFLLFTFILRLRASAHFILSCWQLSPPPPFGWWCFHCHPPGSRN